MTKNQIIEQLFTGKNFNDCIRKMEPEHLQDDLRMEVIAIVCEWPEEKIIGLHKRKELDFFVVRVILNQIQSNSSPFYRKYRQSLLMYLEDTEDFAADMTEARRRHLANVALRANEMTRATMPEEIEERQAHEDMEDEALEEIDNLYWYNATLLKLYGEGKSYRDIQAQTGIPYISCYHTIRKSIKQIKEKIKA